MIIDLFTVIAQIINFLILILLMKKFLFNKIVSIMDEREEQIRVQLAHAEQQEKEAQEEVKKQHEIREKLEREWDNDLAQIKKEVQLKRKEMMEKARESIDKEEESWRNSLEKQRTAFLQELRQLSCQQVCQVSKKVLADLANEKLEKQLIESFLNQLTNMQEDKEQRSRISDFRNKSEIEIWTAFPLDKKEQDQLSEKIRGIFKNETEIIFKGSDNLICGIELRSEGKKISWSIESYLDSLENRLKEMFKEVDFEGNNRVDIKSNSTDKKE